MSSFCKDYNDGLEGTPTTHNPKLLLNKAMRLFDSGREVAFVYMEEEQFHDWGRGEKFWKTSREGDEGFDD